MNYERKRAKPIGLKVTDSVHAFLEKEAERRGVTMTALVAFVVGEWKSQIERKQQIEQQSADRALDSLMANVGPQVQSYIMDKIKEDDQSDWVDQEKG